MPAHRFGHLPTADPALTRHVLFRNVKKCALYLGLFDKSAIKYRSKLSLTAKPRGNVVACQSPWKSGS